MDSTSHGMCLSGHLLHQGDCVIFSQALTAGANRLSKNLEAYSRGSGQLVNEDKSAIFFGANCDLMNKTDVHDRLGIGTEALGKKYLGLPTALGCSTKEAFEKIPERIRNMVAGWGEKKLSFAGREVLLKSVAQAVPTYSMSCFQLSNHTCKKIRGHLSITIFGEAAQIAIKFIG